MPLYCEGCHSKFDREGKLIQHLEKSQSPLCTAAWQSLKAKMHPVRGRIRPNPTRNRNTQAQATHEFPNLDNQEPVPFEGDYFGNNYTNDDFPFPENLHTVQRDLPNVDEQSDHSDSSDSEPDDDHPPENIPPPAAPTALRPHPSDAEEMDVDEMPTDENTPPNAPGGITIHSHNSLRLPPVYITEFPHPKAGAPIINQPASANGYSQYAQQLGADNNAGSIWAPFSSKMEWEVARWAKLRGPGSTAFTELLDIEGVKDALSLSFKNTIELNKIIDQLPSKRPSFTKQEVLVGGEPCDVYFRDIIQCIRALYGDPQHSQYLVFKPERHYADADKTQRLYHDMHTGRWWWDTQKSVEKHKAGATIIPIIISSDKTQITLFRNKTAYPVYLTIGNLPKSIRRKPSRQGQILLAYLPTSRLQHIPNKTARRRTQANLFHACMNFILSPLEEAGIHGISVIDGNGVTRRGHPILAAYVGDYPEQILVTGAFTGDCPLCECPNSELGDYPCQHQGRDLQAVYEALDELGDPDYPAICREANIKPIQHPFWETLPYLNIFQSITPDILHQLHQGVVKHLIAWLTKACGASVIDERVKRLPPNHNIRNFTKGITSLSRVSGTEHRQMSNFLLGLIIDVQLPDGVSTSPLISATRAILDFLYLAQYPVHTDATLTSLDQSLKDFHANKHVFQTLGIRDNFNLPKLHSLLHYVHAIKLYGTADNYNTEATERLHIEFAKDAYRATNRKNEFAQMTKWLERQEKIMHHANYAAWREAGLAPTNLQAMPSGQTQSHQSWEPPDMSCELHPKMTRHPTLKSVHLHTIISQQGYGATAFTAALCRFIVQFQNPGFTRGQIEAAASEIHLPFDSLPIFHRIKFWNQDVHSNETLDSIHAYPARYKEGKKEVESRFDTALIAVKKGAQDRNSAGPVEVPSVHGMRIGQVRVIFSLPENSNRLLFPSGTPPPRHLAYIEWFSRFTPRPDPYLKMYKVSRSYIGEDRLASIIPVSLIQQSVHLFPKWGRDRERYQAWKTETVLEECNVFYLNSFKDRHTYYNVY